MTNSSLLDKVNFTNLSFDPIDAVPEKRVDGPWPSEWTRIVVKISNRDSAAYLKPKKVYAWITKKIHGRWGAYEYLVNEGSVEEMEYRVVLYFEHRNEALLFRLLGGDRAWELND